MGWVRSLGAHVGGTEMYHLAQQATTSNPMGKKF